MKLLLALLGIAISSNVVAADGAANPGADGLVVQFGKPTYVQRLYYRKMYDKKPFRDATLFYYDNGLFKIITPGANHYGTYVVEGRFEDMKYTIHHISLPSVDWGNTNAYHVLEFDRSTRRFKQ